MTMKLWNFYIISALFVGISYGDRLISSVVIFRHGERTPLKFFPNDPYKDRSFWTTAPGELTEEGRLQAYELGKWIRHRYQRFLPNKFSQEEFFIISSDFNRTLQSAQAFSAGLYDSKEEDFKIASKPQKNDHVVLMFGEMCEKYNTLWRELLKSPHLRRLNKKNELLFKNISQFTGMNITSIEGIEKIYDALYIEEFYNKTLPDWVHEIYPTTLHNLAYKRMLLPTYTPKMARLAQGPLMNEIVTYLKSFMNESEISNSEYLVPKFGRKMFAVSGHDSNVVGLLNILNIRTQQWLHFSCALIFELKSRNDSSLYVNIHHKNGDDFTTFKFGSQGTDWNIEDFLGHVQAFAITGREWREECKENTTSKNANISESSTEQYYYR